jgi:hypothetical protein
LKKKSDLIKSFKKISIMNTKWERTQGQLLITSENKIWRGKIFMLKKNWKDEKTSRKRNTKVRQRIYIIWGPEIRKSKPCDTTNIIAYNLEKTN